MTNVHQLQANDPGTLRELLALFAEAFDEPDVYLDRQPEDAYLERWLSLPHCVALVALDDDRVVGGLVAYEFPKFEQARSEFYLYDLAVAESHRRRGIATALIERMREIAADRGAWVMYIQADDGDAAPIALYTQLGTSERVWHFDIAVAHASKERTP